MNSIYTIGYSTWDFDSFAKILVDHRITVVCDVRSSPFSKRNSAFSRRELEAGLRALNIKYAFLGEALGARPSDPECYFKGQARYDRLAARTAFKAGLKKVIDSLARHRPVLMCAEREPIECHRTILVCRQLLSEGIVDIRHVLGDGKVELHADLERRLVRALNLEPPPMFATPAEWRVAIAQAYELQGRKIAYGDKSDPSLDDHSRAP
jgi:uncharacterized protein (DUF488 family)